MAHATTPNLAARRSRECQSLNTSSTHVSELAVTHAQRVVADPKVADLRDKYAHLV